MASSEVVFVHPDQLEWERVEKPAGESPRDELDYHEFAILRVDENTGGLTTLVRYGPRYYEPRHRNKYGHAIYVVRGAMCDADTGEIVAPAGSYQYRPAGEAHGPFAFAPDSLLLFITDGPRDLIVDE
jgi:quercetin dioxygenase-like cupin family protein